MARWKPPGRGDSTAIHHAHWLSRRKSITGVRPTLRLASRSLFHSAGSARPGPSRLVALYLYAATTATLPMEVDARLPRSGPGILLHYSGGRACDERRQIAAGTRWINLLSISSVTSPRHSRSRIVAPRQAYYSVIILLRASLQRNATPPAASNPKRGAKLLDGTDALLFRRLATK